MTDLTQVSNDELLASLPRGVRSNNPLNLKGADGQFRNFASQDEGLSAADANLAAYGSKYGINTVNGVVSRWAPASDGNHPAAYAAHVSQRLGLKPDQQIDLADPGTRQQVLSAMSEFENGGKVLAGPDLSKVSDDELLASLGQPKTAPGPQRDPSAGPQTIARSHNGGPPAPQRPPPQPTVAQDIGSGFAQPFVNLGHDIMQVKREHDARLQAGAPKSLADFAQRSMADLKEPFQIAGDVIGLAGAPVQAAVRPVARAVNSSGVPLFQPPQVQISSKGISFSDPRRLAPEERQGALEGMINTALAGVKPAGRTPSLPKPSPMSLDQVKAAKDAAYAAVDASGFRVPSNHVQTLADDMATQIRDLGGPKGAKLLASSDAMQARLAALAKQKGGVPVSQLDKLRSDLYDVLVKPGGPDSKVGATTRQSIDGLLDSINAPELRTARDLNTRYMKMKEVTNRVESANLAQETSGTGGNQNAIRQKLRPTIDPKSPQQIRNFTPAEVAAVRQVTKGTPAQNALRLLTAFDPTAGKLQAMLSTGAAGATGGHSLLLAPLGMAAKAGERALAQRSLQNLLDLISKGGVPYVRPPVPPAAPGSVGLFTPRGLIGAGAVASRLVPKPADEGSSTPNRSRASAGR